MGLGLHGGGLSSALFFLKAGAKVTVTDMKKADQLKASIDQLKGHDVKFTLGEHREEDFTKADMIIKNPGVPGSSKWLKMAALNNIAIESDISIFLRSTTNPVIAVTGSKGKSTTVSAIFKGLQDKYPDARLGGNITRSPLSFIHELPPTAPVVLELSSWQLADLAGKNLLRARVSVITNILPDHMNAYASMNDYFKDKQQIYKDQQAEDFSIFNYDDPYLRPLAEDSPAQSLFFSAKALPKGINGAWLDDEKRGHCRLKGKNEWILPAKLALAGEHNRLNLLCAALVLRLFELDSEKIADSLSQFTGIEHRMELFLTKGSLKFYNDSAATIPQATAEAVKSLEKPLYLITGGTDKNSDYSPYSEIAMIPDKIFLLKGSGTEKIQPLLDQAGAGYGGPYENLASLLDALTKEIGSKGSVVLSPGCASFELFDNEFDRGRQFKAGILQRFTDQP